MPREDLIAGLQAALDRGQSLKQAMMSFLNAGYPKSDIIEASKAIQFQQVEQQMAPGYKQPIVQTNSQTQQPVIQTTQQTNQQKVSNYEQPTKKPKSRIWMIILFLFLLALLAGLASLIFFRTEVINFFNSSF